MTPRQNGTWTYTFRVRNSGKDGFFFLRDGDTKQAIYPACSCSQPGVPACGPDNLGEGKCWLVNGEPGEEITVTLQVVQAEVTLTMSGSRRIDKVWRNRTG